MPFTDPEEARAYRREYQRKWYHAKKAADPEKLLAQGREAARKHRKRHPERVREREAGYRAKLRKKNPHHDAERKIHAVPGTRARLMSEQSGLCAICARDMELLSRIDHCHTTGKVRELLCHHCNVSLGHMQDDPARLRAAADYVEKHRKLHATQDALSEQPSGSNREPPPHSATQISPSP